ncbi:hypothetical protein QOT17_014025 [Balamuthia mandrillaris]
MKLVCIALVLISALITLEPVAVLGEEKECPSDLAFLHDAQAFLKNLSDPTNVPPINPLCSRDTVANFSVAVAEAGLQLKNTLTRSQKHAAKLDIHAQKLDLVVQEFTNATTLEELLALSKRLLDIGSPFDEAVKTFEEELYVRTGFVSDFMELLLEASQDYRNQWYPRNQTEYPPSRCPTKCPSGCPGAVPGDPAKENAWHNILLRFTKLVTSTGGLVITCHMEPVGDRALWLEAKECLNDPSLPLCEEIPESIRMWGIPNNIKKAQRVLAFFRNVKADGSNHNSFLSLQ